MKNTITHNMDTWFKEVIDVNDATKPSTYLEWFETGFQNNRLGAFKVPHSTLKRFSAKEEQFFKAIGQGYIELIKKLKPKLKSIPFAMLEAEDREALREFIGEQIQFSMINKQVFQIVNGSNISSPTFTMNLDTTPWAFTVDMLSNRGKVLMQNAEIDLYDIVDEGVLYQETQNNNIKVLRLIDLEKDVPAIVWDTI